jgi:hypothetical protein
LAKATRVRRPRGNPRGRWWHGGGGGALGFPRGRWPPTPSTAYINPLWVPWLIHSLSLLLFFLTWLPRLELCQRVERNSSCRTLSRCQISSLNPYLLPLLCWTGDRTMSIHRTRVIIRRRRLCGAVFFDWYDYMTLRSASVIFIDNVRVGTFPRTHSSRV